MYHFEYSSIFCHLYPTFSNSTIVPLIFLIITGVPQPVRCQNASVPWSLSSRCRLGQGNVPGQAHRDRLITSLRASAVSNDRENVVPPDTLPLCSEIRAARLLLSRCQGLPAGTGCRVQCHKDQTLKSEFLIEASWERFRLRSPDHVPSPLGPPTRVALAPRMVK